MKKALILVLCTVVLLSSIMVGCSKTDDNKTTEKTPDTSGQTTEQAKDQEPDEITVVRSYSMDYNNYSLKNSRTEWPAVKELEKKSNVKIKWKMYPNNEFNTLVQTELAAGSNLSDIYISPPKGDALLENGVTVDIFPLIKSQAPNLMRLIDQYPEIVPLRTLEDGRMWGFPTTISSPVQQLPAIALRNDWLDKLGLAEPTTVDEFTNVLRAFRDDDPNGNGKKDEVPFTARRWYWVNFLSPGFGIYVHAERSGNEAEYPFYPDVNDKIQVQLLRPEYKEYITWLNLLYKEKLIDNKIFTPEDMEGRVVELLQNATIGGFIWNSTNVVDGFGVGFIQKVVPDGGFIQILPPKSKFVDKIETRRNDTLNGSFVITKSCKNLEAVMRFVDFCFSDEGTDLGNWGIEGDSYTVVDGKKMPTEKMFMNEDGWWVPEAYGMRDWLNVLEYEAGAKMGQLSEVGIANHDKMAAVATAKYYSLDSIPLTTTERVLRDRMLPDIKTYMDENMLKFIVGTRPMDEWDVFIDELVNKLKINDAVDGFLQPSYDRYLKTMQK